MPQDNLNKTKKVAFFHTGQDPLAPLSSALRSCSEFSYYEFAGTAEDIAGKAVASHRDVIVLFFPEIDGKLEACINRILAGSVAPILMLTRGAVPSSIIRSGRVEIYLCPKKKTLFDDVLSHVLHMLSEGKKPAADTHKAGSPAADTAVAGKIVAVGASTGGTEALAQFFHGLRPRMPGIVVVQHMPPVFTAMFADRLSRELPFEVTEATDNVQIRPNCIYIAPGDKHLKIKRIGSSFYTVVGGTQKVSGHCPSVDALFKSVAEVAGSNACGVILTGMGGDGAEGMLEMHRRGAFTIGQDEASCVVYGMPRKAFEIGAVDRQAPLGDIAGILMKQLGV